MRNALLTLILLAILATIAAANPAGFFAGYAAARLRAGQEGGDAPLTYPADNDLYSSAYGWWVFESEVDPQPDSKGDADLTVNGASWGDGAYAFDGTGNQYLYDFTNDYNSASTSGAINVWIKPNPLTRSTVMLPIAFRNNTTATKHLNIYYYGPSAISTLRNKLYISFNDATSYMYTPAVVTTNAWQMMTCVSDGSSYVWYRNGEKLAAGLNGGTQGKWFDAAVDRDIILFGISFPGSIGDVSVLNGTITSNQIYKLWQDTKDTYE